uniref:Uncharacterized protein n=1 Tax=Kalanchoe fedtschenkoi TaxID=63787 RepID=A0A7N1A3F7_KALFE
MERCIDKLSSINGSQADVPNANPSETLGISVPSSQNKLLLANKLVWKPKGKEESNEDIEVQLEKPENILILHMNSPNRCSSKLELEAANNSETAMELPEIQEDTDISMAVSPDMVRSRESPLDVPSYITTRSNLARKSNRKVRNKLKKALRKAEDVRNLYYAFSEAPLSQEKCHENCSEKQNNIQEPNYYILFDSPPAEFFRRSQGLRRSALYHSSCLLLPW